MYLSIYNIYITSVRFFFQLWSASLRKIIRCCYAHHKSSYLLEFSGRLMEYVNSIDNYVFLDNGDGTRTLKNTRNGKLMVTFR